MKKFTRSKLKSATIERTIRQVQIYAAGSSSSEDSEGSEYKSRESTPFSSISTAENQAETKQYLVYDEEIYQYKLKENSIRWIVNNFGVSEAFFKYRDAAISKAEDLQNLNDHEQLALNGIMMFDSGFVNTDIVNYEEVQHIFNDILQIDVFKSSYKKKSQKELVIKCTNDPAT